MAARAVHEHDALRGSVEPLSIRAGESTPRGAAARGAVSVAWPVPPRDAVRLAPLAGTGGVARRMNTFYFMDEESGERVEEIEPHVADCIVAVKEERASPEEEPHFSLTQKMRRDGLRIECGCRPDLPRGPRLGTRRKRDGRTFVVNLPKQDVAHAENCVFRVERPPLPPIVHSDVFKLISCADADRGDIDPDSPVNRKSRGLSQGQRPRTMRGRSVDADAHRTAAQARSRRRVFLVEGMARSNRESR